MKTTPTAKTQKAYGRRTWKFWRFGRKAKVRRNVKDRLFRFLFEKDRADQPSNTPVRGFL